MADEGVKMLKPWEEVVGKLEDLHQDDEDGFHVEIGGVGVYEFLTFEKGYTDFLDAIAKIPKGSKIGILRTDDDFRVRMIIDSIDRKIHDKGGGN